VKVQLYNDFKNSGSRRRLVAMGSKGSRVASTQQRRASLVGGGAKWQITNLRQVAGVMARWA
jgi:hypothetical protein